MRIFLLLTSLNFFVAAQAQHFPTDWFGQWEGELTVCRGDSTLMEVPMQLIVGPEEVGVGYQWTIIYNPGPAEDRRAYHLVQSDSLPWRWQIDEDNGIILGAEYHHGVLFSRFAVGITMLLARYELVDEALTYEIVMGPKDQARTTGDVVLPTGDSIPPVEVFALGTRQYARLIRIP